VMTCDFSFLRVAQDELFGDGIFCGGESDFRFGARGLRSSDADGSVGKLGSQLAQLEVVGLENDEVFEVRIHKGRG